jgi:MFS family permease
MGVSAAETASVRAECRKRSDGRPRQPLDESEVDLMTTAVRAAGFPGAAGDALERLDARPPTAFYWRLTLLATLGGFLFGYDTSNIGSALNFVPWHVSGFSEGYLVAGASIGADSAIATAYIAEYAPRGRRGSLALLQQWMITVGILVAYVIAIIVFRFWGSTAGTVDWRLILGLGAVPALVGLVLRVQMPESPRWLLKKGRYADARTAFGTLGIDTTEDELHRSAQRLEATEGGTQPGTRPARGPRMA